MAKKKVESARQSLKRDSFAEGGADPAEMQLHRFVKALDSKASPRTMNLEEIHRRCEEAHGGPILMVSYSILDD
ncbi:MAG: hypothetical protein SGJ02_04000 [bacterium]|nr:hypothetical protein [bacterium]